MNNASSRLAVGLGLALLFGSSVFGCGSDTTTTPAATPGTDSGSTGATPDVTITASNFMFAPQMVTIKAGQTVRWNFMSGTHNVVSGTTCTSDGKFTSGSPMAAPNTFDHTFPAAGTFAYFCNPHCASGMTGMVTVTP